MVQQYNERVGTVMKAEKLQLAKTTRENLRRLMEMGYQGTLYLCGPDADDTPNSIFFISDDELHFYLEGGRLYRRVYNTLSNPIGVDITDVDKIPFERYPLPTLLQKAKEIEKAFLTINIKSTR